MLAWVLTDAAVGLRLLLLSIGFESCWYVAALHRRVRKILLALLEGVIDGVAFNGAGFEHSWPTFLGEGVGLPLRVRLVGSRVDDSGGVVAVGGSTLA